MSYYDLEKEKAKHPHGTYGGIVTEEVHDNKKFLLKQIMHYVVDAYGYDGSVDLAHCENGNYYEVCDYIPLDENVETLDLTWMDSDDIVDFSSYRGEHHKLVKSIDINIDNMGLSHIDSMKDIVLNVYPGDENIGIVQQVRRFNNFLHCNDDRIDELNLIGFGPLTTAILSNYAERYRVFVNKRESVRTRQ